MLRIKNYEFRLITQGYHFDENGKKFVRVFGSLGYYKVQVKIQAHKEMHIKSKSVIFPYVITDNWVEIMINSGEWVGYANDLFDYIDIRCKEIWFV